LAQRTLQERIDVLRAIEEVGGEGSEDGDRGCGDRGEDGEDGEGYGDEQNGGTAKVMRLTN
jgi:hypothetical protein